jgi:sigma-B regulation protein RsbU (phosphoserine phosphatase)
MFATVLCGHLDTRSGKCTLANAGHEAPLLVHANGYVETLAVPTGPPLGFEVSTDFRLWHGWLQPGDSLLAYTDGVSEAFDTDNQAYGNERILSAVGPEYSAHEQCARLIADVHRFAGAAPQSDDITVLAIRRSVQTMTPDGDQDSDPDRDTRIVGHEEGGDVDSTDRSR